MDSCIEEVVGCLEDSELHTCRHRLLQVLVDIIDGGVHLSCIGSRSLVDDKCHTGLSVYTGREAIRQGT